MVYLKVGNEGIIISRAHTPSPLQITSFKSMKRSRWVALMKVSMRDTSRLPLNPSREWAAAAAAAPHSWLHYCTGTPAADSWMGASKWRNDIIRIVQASEESRKRFAMHILQKPITQDLVFFSLSFFFPFWALTLKGWWDGMIQLLGGTQQCSISYRKWLLMNPSKLLTSNTSTLSLTQHIPKPNSI